MNPLSFISGLFNVIAGFFGYVSKRSDLNNTPEMKKRDELRKETEQNDEDSKDIRNADLDAIRRKSSL